MSAPIAPLICRSASSFEPRGSQPCDWADVCTDPAGQLLITLTIPPPLSCCGNQVRVRYSVFYALGPVLESGAAYGAHDVSRGAILYSGEICPVAMKPRDATPLSTFPQKASASTVLCGPSTLTSSSKRPRRPNTTRLLPSAMRIGGLGPNTQQVDAPFPDRSQSV